MAPKFRSATVVPASGGKLMARLSADSVSAADYTVKRDFHRIADVESRRCGFTPFHPNTDLPLGYQNYPEPPPYQVPISGTSSVVGVASGTGILQAAPDPW